MKTDSKMAMNRPCDTNLTDTTHYPSMGRELFLSLLSIRTATYNETPRWRDWDYKRLEPILQKNLRDFVLSIQECLIELASTDEQHWPYIIRELASFAPDDRSEIYSQLNTIDQETIGTDTRKAIWTAIKNFVTRHRPYPNAQRALPEGDLDQLEELQGKFAPLDPASRHQGLFGDSPTLPAPRKESWREQEEAVEEAQIRAAREVLDAGGIQAILEFAQEVQAPQWLGRILAKLGLTWARETSILEAGLGTKNDSLRILSTSYIAVRAGSEEGSKWTDGRLEEARQQEWSPQKLADFYCGLPPGEDTWERLGRESQEVGATYWQKVNVGSVRDPHEVTAAVQKLLAASRPSHALSLYRFSPELVPSEVLAETLETLAVEGSEEGHRKPATHDIRAIFQVLQENRDIDPERLLRLEWLYLDLGLADTLPQAALFAKLADEPAFFVQLLTWLYKPRGNSVVEEKAAEIPDERRQVLASKAFQILKAWKGMPGLSSEGRLDVEKLRNWVEESRERLKKLGRLTVGDQEIGQILARAPTGDDGIWPAEEVRELIERLRSRDIETGISLGIQNSRGVVSRGPGGDQERELAQRFEADAKALSGKWPRTARTLRMIADSYASQAHYWDERKELDDL